VAQDGKIDRGLTVDALRARLMGLAMQKQKPAERRKERATFE
jgi:hypothetical protein